MKLKKLLSLLLALTMIFSLAACAGSDSKDDDEDDEETVSTDKDEPGKDSKKDPDYQYVLDAVKELSADESLEAACGVLGGKVLGDELYDLIKTEADAELIDPSSILEEIAGEVGVTTGTPCEITVNEETALDDAEIEDYQDHIAELAESFDEASTSLSDLHDQLLEQVKNFTEDEMAQLDEQFLGQFNMTFDEYLELFESLAKSVDDIAAKLKTAKVKAGCTVSVTIEDEDGESDEEYVLLNIDGDWTHDMLVEMLDGFVYGFNKMMTAA